MFTGEYVKRKDECDTSIWQRQCFINGVNPDDVFKIERAVGRIWLILEGIDYCWQETSFDVVTPVETNNVKLCYTSADVKLIFNGKQCPPMENRTPQWEWN